MAKKLYEEEDIRGIARAIRTKNKSQNTYRVDQMEQAVLDIETSKPQQSKTVSPSTSQQTVTADEGYELASVKVNAMPDGALNLGFNTSTGLISASVSAAGYVDSTDDKTQKLTVQAGKTVTPSTSNQTAVAANRWTTGAVIVKGDANLKAENIAKGKSIFGIGGVFNGFGLYAWNKYNAHYGTGTEPIPTKTTCSWNFLNANSVEYNGNVYIPYNNLLYRYDENSTSLVATNGANWDITGCATVVYNNEIHCLGGTSYPTKHNVWNGTTWKTLKDLPMQTKDSKAVVYNGEIHLLGSSVSSYGKKHYKWDSENDTWSEVSTLPFTNAVYDSPCVVYNNRIYQFGTAYGGNKSVYYWDGLTWHQDQTMPCRVNNSIYGIIDGKIHFAGGYQRKYTVFDGESWTEPIDLDSKYTTEPIGFFYNETIYLAYSASPYTICKAIYNRWYKDNFVETVMSENATDFPEDDAKDEEWYIRLKESTADAGTVTVSGRMFTIAHTLGRVPEHILFCATSAYAYSRITSGFDGKCLHSNEFQTFTLTKDETSVTINTNSSSYTFDGTYQWVVW